MAPRACLVGSRLDDVDQPEDYQDDDDHADDPDAAAASTHLDLQFNYQCGHPAVVRAMGLARGVASFRPIGRARRVAPGAH